MKIRTFAEFWRPFSWRASLSIVAALAGPRLASGQVAASDSTTKKSEQKEAVTVELSPFVVSASKDTGYQASDTLAGTRLRTSLRDVATAISVVTKDLLQDTGSANATDILVYTTGTEVTGMGGNFGNAETNAEGATRESANFRVPNTRVRGLAGADLTRDYFPTSIPFDSYNTDRVEINRGANAALFGLGSPAGIINTALTLAERRNFGSLSVQTGSFNSWRATLDVNRSPGAGFAVRVAGVYDERKFEQKPAFIRSEREYVAALWEPTFLQKKGILSGVVFRANYEAGRKDSNSPRTLTPAENISRYFAVGKPTWDPPTSDLAAADRNIYSHVLTFTLGTLWPDPNSPVPGQGTVGIVNPARPPSATTGLPIFATYGTTTRLQTFLTRTGGDPFIVNPSLSDEKVFDFRHYMIDGPNKKEFIDFGAFNASVETRLLKDKVGLQAAYNHENFKSGAVDWFRGVSFDSEIYVDYNLRMFDGTANPNYGRPFVLSRGVTDFQRQTREGRRATAYYTLNTSDLVGRTSGRWLGKHTLTGSVSDQITRSMYNGGNTYYSDRGELLKYQGTANPVDVNTGISPIMAYIGPSVANLTSLSQVRLQPITVEMRPDLLTAEQSRFIVWNPTTRRWENQSVRIFRQEPESMPYPGSNVTTSDKIRSQVAVLQSTMLHDNVVFTGSWRSDKVESFLAANPTPTLSAESESTSYGVVARVPRRYTEKIPKVSYLGLFYNSSQNFQPGQLRRYATGGAIPSPSGTTRDIGGIVELFGGKLNLRATWFDTKQKHVSAGMSIVSNSVGVLEARVLSRIREGFTAANLQVTSPGITQAEVDRQVALWKANPFPYANIYFVNPDPPAGQSIQTRSGGEDTLDLSSKGLEMEAVYNPTSHWRIAFNATKQEAQQDNTGTTTLRFIQERMELWNQTPNLPTTETYSNSVRMDQTTILSNYYRIANRDGTLRPEVRKWRVNFLTNYRFTTGRLAGWAVGGAYRWEDKAGVGYQTFFDPALRLWRIDPTKPWYSPAQDYVDGWASYRRKIFDGKIHWVTQLNIRNLLDSDRLVVTYRNPDGTPALFRTPEGRRWQLSSTFEF